MAYFLLGLCLIGALLLAGRFLLSADPRRLARVVRMTLGCILAVGAVGLLVMGRPMLAGLLGMGALMAFGRMAPGMGMGPGGGGLFGGILGTLFGGGQAGGRTAAGPDWSHVGRGSDGRKTSEVRTAWLQMTLDHETGEMSGLVLDGAFRGRRVEALEAGELAELLRECELSDPDSVTLLEAYLDRAVGPDWRRQAGRAGGGGNDTGGAREGARSRGRRSDASAPGSGRMSVAEAREVLGVAAGASPDEIREAHRTLMKKLHPDHGGSNYLAGKINQAKDVLLGT